MQAGWKSCSDKEEIKMDWKMHDGYWITAVLPVNGKEMMFGVHQEKGSHFATWEHRGEEFLWAHYFTDMTKAIEDLCKRTLHEIEFMRKKGADLESVNSFTGFIKNDRNRAVIEFPTNELQDILESIGIMEGAGAVCLSGQYPIELEPARDKFADALIHVLGSCDSLHTVNELAKAAYHSDYRVYLMLEENLKQGVYHSPEQLFKDVEEKKEQIRQASKGKKR